MHGMTTQALEGGWGAFHIWQAVPIFIVLLGLNAAYSAQRHGIKLGSYYRVSRPPSASDLDHHRRFGRGRGDHRPRRMPRAQLRRLAAAARTRQLLHRDRRRVRPPVPAAVVAIGASRSRTVVGMMAIEVVFSLDRPAPSDLLEVAGTGHRLVPLHERDPALAGRHRARHRGWRRTRTFSQAATAGSSGWPASSIVYLSPSRQPRVTSRSCRTSRTPSRSPYAALLIMARDQVAPGHRRPVVRGLG